MHIGLLAETGIEQIDSILRGLVGLFEVSFPGRIRGCFLTGSYSDGTAVDLGRTLHSSDIDLLVVFKDTVAEGEGESFRRIVQACRQISPTQLDVHAVDEDDLWQQPTLLTVLLKISSMPIYGEDIRAALPQMPLPNYILNLIDYGVYHMGIHRQGGQRITYPLTVPLSCPVAYPDPSGEFYGYDFTSASLGQRRGTRVLIVITCWIATTILALKTGRYAGRKSESIQLCKQYLSDDQRAQFAATLYDTCKGQWGYAIPENRQERAHLRGFCRDALALENDYLLLCRDYLLGRLRDGSDDEKMQAARTLQNVVYPGEEVASTLNALAHAAHEGVRNETVRALEVIGQHAGP
jgi:hypothetical protein